jgi:hypothetical protein
VGLREGDVVRSLVELQGRHEIRYTAPVGAVRELHAVAIGKVYLAAMSPDQFAAWFDRRKPARYTERTLVTEAALREDLEDGEVRGYQRALGEYNPDGMGLAVPLQVGTLKLVVGVAGPLARMQPIEAMLAHRLTRGVRQLAAVAPALKPAGGFSPRGLPGASRYHPATRVPGRLPRLRGARMTDKKFASQADLQEKQVTFSQLSEHAWAYTAEGDPNTGVIIGDDAVLVADTQATPAMAADVIRRIREVTDKPIRFVVLTHYHAVRVLGASAYGAPHILASQDTRDLIVERGEQDKASEIGRFPRLFRNVETVPAGMTWPTMTFTGKMTLWLGSLEVAAAAAGPRPHQGRHRRVAARRAHHALGRPRGVRRHALCGRRLLRRLAADAAQHRGAAAAGARARARPGAGGRAAGGARAAGHARVRERPVRERARRRGRRARPEDRLPPDLRRARAEVRQVGDLRPLHALRRDARL